MRIRVLEDPIAGACLYESVTERAFGPLFESNEDAEDFLMFAGERDIAVFPWTPATEEAHTEWLKGEGR